MTLEDYRTAFKALYPNYGSEPLMEMFGISRRYAIKIAHRLGVRTLPRERRTCREQGCPKPLRAYPSYTGNLCMDHFNRRRKGLEADPVLFLRRLFHRAKTRSAKKGIPFDLTQEHLRELWVRQGRKCYYSHVEMTTKGRERDPYGVSLDRVYPDQGYTRGNVVLCCWAVNMAKGETTLEEFFHLCRQVAENTRFQELLKVCGDEGPRTDPVVGGS